jgi:N-acetylneuraminic acid mutarotase
MKYLLLFSPTVALGLVACNPEAATESDTGGSSPNASAAAVAAGSWRTRAAYPTDVYEAESASITDPATLRTTLYVIGGRGNPRRFNSVSRAVRAYDVSANAWQSRAQFPVRLTGANGAVVINGRIYVPGGVTSFRDPEKGWRGRTLQSLYVYDPSTNEWTRLRNMPYPSAYGVSGTYRGHLYVATYCDDVAVCGDGELLRYNPSTNRWMVLGRTPHSPAFAAGGFVSGKFYLVDNAGHVDIYDVGTKMWSTGQQAPFSFCPATSTTFQGKLYLVGCHDSGDFSGMHPMLVFDPRSGVWSEAAAPPIVANWHWWTLSRVVVNGRPGLELVGGAYPGNHAQFMP